MRKIMLGFLILTLAGLAPAQENPRAIVDKMQALYQSLPALAVRVKVTTQVRTLKEQATLETTGSIRLARPTLYNIAWQSTPTSPTARRHGAVWNAGEEAQIYLGTTNEYTTCPNDETARSIAAGMSDGVADLLPDLFLSGETMEPGMSRWASLSDLKGEGPATLDGRPCQVVSARLPALSRMRIWIAQPEPLILKVEEMRSSAGEKKELQTAGQSDAALDDFLKSIGEAVTPENREKLKKSMNLSLNEPAEEDYATTTTTLFTYDPPKNKTTSKDFAYALPKGAKKRDSLIDDMSQAGGRAYNTKFKEGDQAPDFTATTLDGKTIKLADLKGNVVLLDFWSTRCGPCIYELPNVIKLYKEFKPQGLVLIGISLDESTDRLPPFFERHPGMVWPQICNGNGGKGELAQTFGVEAIPFTLLLDRTGKIAHKSLRGEKLRQAVAGMLKGGNAAKVAEK